MSTKMNAYIARQPIFNKKIQVRAYELLFHNNMQEKLSSGVHFGTGAEHDSPRVVMESFQTMGVDTITGSKPAFINFPPALLLEKIATLFPKELVVIKLPKNIEPTPEIVAECRDLCQRGYTLSLDIVAYQPSLDPLIELCKILGFNFLLLEQREIAETLKRINITHKQLLAEKIESAEAFDQAAAMGFSLFQGYFFSKPVMLASKEIAPIKSSYISLLKEINSTFEPDFNKLGEIIQNDVALSYKLLLMANAPYYGMRSQITDIKHALAVLGVVEVRKWVYLMALLGMHADKPSELIRISMIRGKFMEQINRYCQLPYSAENMFLTGLFSLLDVLLDQPMATALSNIVLAPEVYEALATREGPLQTLLNLIIGVERGTWKQADILAAIFGLSTSQVTEVYLDAVQWCNDIPF